MQVSKETKKGPCLLFFAFIAGGRKNKRKGCDRRKKRNERRTMRKWGKEENAKKAKVNEERERQGRLYVNRGADKT